MFASSGLFVNLPCPFLPDCSRETFCIFSHNPLSRTEGPISSSSVVSLSQSSTTTTPTRSLKRKLDQTTVSIGARKERPQQLDRNVGDKDHSAKLPSEHQQLAPKYQTPISAMEAAKRRRQALESTPSTPSKPTIFAGAKTSSGAVLLARPQATQKTIPASPSIKMGGSNSGPPVLKIDLRAHSKPQFRQAVATQYYKEFLRIYASLSEAGSCLATDHAIDQEKAVHSKTNQGSYRGIAATVLQRLKKRPAAISGFELIRISVVDKTGKTIMDELVKPKNTVLDLNSRFSGITSIDGAKYSLEQARDQFLGLIDSDTIIVGQSLENDFKVLRLIHTRVIDTAMLVLTLTTIAYFIAKVTSEHSTEDEDDTNR
ncbi:hypothetical protein BGX27_004933 [Mortierella sp. AM989]|nr:hypothetical protein BGX27_004933 [Mortierella sp. AM989]